MNFPYSPKSLTNPMESFGDRLDHAAEKMADGITGALAQALTDPIVRAVMVADGVEPQTVISLMVEMTAKLARRAARPCWEHC